MTTQLDTVQPIELITTSDFDQDFAMLKNGRPFDLTGLTEAKVSLMQKDGHTLSVFTYTAAGGITFVGDPKLGVLHLHFGFAVAALLKITDGKDVDFVCTGPWGVQTFRAKAVLSVKSPSVGA